MAETADERDQRGTTLLVVGGVAVAIVLLVGLLSVIDATPGTKDLRDRRTEVVDAAAAWLDAFERDDRPTMRTLVAAPAPDLAPTVEGFHAGLAPRSIDTEAGRPVLVGDRATVPVTVTVELPGLGPWTFENQLALLDVEVPATGEGDGDGDDEPDRAYRVAFTPATVHPDLAPGRRLESQLAWPARGALQAVDGAPLPDAGPLRSITGAVGPATAEQADRLGGAYEPGHPVGQFGLQAGFEEQLAGEPSGTVRLLEGDRELRVLATFEGRAGADVRTTLDLGLLDAAEAVLARTDKSAALVAIQPSTGAIRAVASRPRSGFNRALLGRYPPGSTFKVVTAAALLASGVTPDTPIDCPAETTIRGRRIRNAEGEALGRVPFRQAFFRSCNTAFVRLASELPAADLVAMARRFGFDRAPDLGVDAGTSQFPEPNGVVDQVSAAIGQGRVLATPMQMASVAATVAGGGHRPPHLVAVPVPPELEPLPAGVAETLQELMRLVVSQGTGTRAQLAGEPVAGKTGTAEFGTAVPLRTHAWFIGFRGDLAVAVVVEDGGFGGEVAAPIAADFLARAG